MSSPSDHRRIDIQAFCATQGQLHQQDAMQKYERLLAQFAPEAGSVPLGVVDWQAQGQLRVSASHTGVPWLHLQATAMVPLTCQRCLTPVQVPLEVDRWFRFVADEATAEREDEDAKEDLLAISHEFDLHGLVEDELLMELPAVPRHDDCPVVVQLSAGDDEFEAAFEEKTNPFAALTSLKGLATDNKDTKPG